MSQQVQRRSRIRPEWRELYTFNGLRAAEGLLAHCEANRRVRLAEEFRIVQVHA